MYTRCDETENLKKKKRPINREEAVNTQGTGEGLSTDVTQTKPQVYVQDNSDLMEKVVESRNLRRAFKRVKRNKGAPGVDGMTTQELQKYLNEHWLEIKQALLDGTYKPSPVRRVEIPKPDGGVRLLGIPTVLDRFIQQAIQQVLTEIFDPQFSEESYGFRQNRSAKQAVKVAQQHIQKGKRHVVDIDLEKFFDRVNHDILMGKLSKRIKDTRVMRIIRRYLQAGVMLSGCCVRTEEGTPQGGPISPLLANIMLDDLDKELTKRGHSFVRYADDCNIYVASARAGRRVFTSIIKFLESKLKLKTNMHKSAVDRPWKRTFLGFTFSWGRDTKLRLSKRAVSRFKDRIRRLTNRNWSVSMEQRIKKLNEYLIGWSGYFATAENKYRFRDLDGWIRRRLRMVLLKQWKRCKTKLRNLVRLGLPKTWAGCIAFSRKKYWRLANTPQVNRALDLDFWQELGLTSLLERYHRVRKTL